ncbi:MAG: Deep-sea thermophilic phage [Bacteroidota bacterium]|jgi:hypothetical protein
MQEIWKTIHDFPCYEISNNSFVRVKIAQKHKSMQGKILQFRLGGNKKQYRRVGLARNGKQIDKYVHRLVLQAFVGDAPQGKPQAAHLDGNPFNNHISNLKWVDNKENQSHRIIHGTDGRGEKNSSSKINKKQAIEIIKRYSKGESSISIAKEYIISQGNVLGIATGRFWKHIGEKELIEKCKIIAKTNRGNAINEKRKTDKAIRN